jgi:signal transduction histidine kinase
MMNDVTYAIVFTTLIILLLIAGVIITIFIANKQRIQREVAYEKELRAVENEVQEQTLTNVSRELHDNIGQMLTFMHLQIERQKQENPDAKSSVKPLEETLASTIQQVKLLGRSLNTDMLEENGLLMSIEQEVTRLQMIKSVAINWENDNVEPILKKDQRLMAFRMFQEILNNAFKHSGAKKISISLSGNKVFMLTIADDGKGFDLNKKMEESSGMGLRNITKRAAMAGFKSEIVASEGKGCIFRLELA